MERKHLQRRSLLLCLQHRLHLQQHPFRVSRILQALLKQVSSAIACYLLWKSHLFFAGMYSCFSDS